MKKENLQLNTGYIHGGLPTDYILGSTSPIVYEVRNQIADWDTFLGIGEKQKHDKFDSMDCVTESATNSVEAQVNWMISNNLLPVEALKFLTDNGYIDKHNQLNCSGRFTAKMSGTTQAGNTFTNVWNSIRHNGLVPEIKWPVPETFSWNDYYSLIPQELKDLGQEFLKHFTIQYEFLDPNISNLVKSLKHAPIQLAVATCPPWVYEVPVCPNQPNHGIITYKTIGQVVGIFDSYDPFRKILNPGYKIWNAVKGIVSPIKPVKAPLFYRLDNLQFGRNNDDVTILQKLLNIVEPPTGYYGIKTKDAVYGFQQAYKVAGLWELLFVRGRYVGPKTLAKLEEVFNK